MFNIDKTTLDTLKKIDACEDLDKKLDDLTELFLTTPLTLMRDGSVMELSLLDSLYFDEDAEVIKSLIPDEEILSLATKITKESYRPRYISVHSNPSTGTWCSDRIVAVTPEEASELDADKCAKGSIIINFKPYSFVFYCADGIKCTTRCTDKNEMIQFIENLQFECACGPEYQGYLHEIDKTLENSPLREQFMRYIDPRIDSDGYYLDNYPLLLVMSDEVAGDLDVVKAAFEHQTEPVAWSILERFVKVHNPELYKRHHYDEMEQWVNTTYGTSFDKETVRRSFYD